MLTRAQSRTFQLCCFAGALLGAPAVFGQSYLIHTVAGTTRLKDGAPATGTPLRYPWGAVEDAKGDVYIADGRDNRILMVATDGTIHIIAGTGLQGFGGDGGPALNAQFNGPRGLCLDGKGGLYVADYGNSRVRLISLSAGTIKTVAGNGNYQWSGDQGPATLAGIDPDDIALDSAGNLYIADFFNNRIREVAAGTQIISTLAGQAVYGDAGDGGPASKAVLSGPLGVSVGAQGILYFADVFNNYVRQINLQTGVINVFAGNGNLGLVDNAPAATSPVAFPIATAVEADGNVLILEDNYIQRVTLPDNTLHIVAGSATLGYGGDGGAVSQATFSLPVSLSTAANGDYIISDTGNFRVRRVTGSLINLVAGTSIANNVPATSAFLNQPTGVAVGTNGFTFPDTSDSMVRSVSGGVITNIAGTGVASNGPGELAFPTGVALDGQGNVYVADTSNNRVLRLVKGGSFEVIAGTGTAGYSGDHGSAVVAKLYGPTSVAVDASGNVYIADNGNCVIRMVDANQNITTIAGNGVCASTGNNGPASSAAVDALVLALDNSGNLFFAEPDTHRIRRINLNSMMVIPVAGIGSPGYTGDGGDAATAQLNGPTGVAVDLKGNVFIADKQNSVVRMITTTGTIWTVAGTGKYPFDLESGPALGVSIDPGGVATAADGSVYVADYFNDRIRELTPVVPAKVAASSGTVASGAPGQQIAVSVTVTDSSGNPVSGAIVTFSVTSGSAQLSATTVETNASGVAIVLVTLGSPGTIQIQATTQGLPAVTLSVTSAGPQISAGGVEGAGLSVPPVTSLSTGGIATVFGSGFGGPSTYVAVGSGDLVNGAVPTIFKGICVEVAGTKAPIFGVSNTQVNFQVPAISSASASVQVVANCGAANAEPSSGVTAPIAAASPEFFYFQTNSSGKNPVAATDAITNNGIAAAGLFPGSGFQPAYPGEIVTVYATGFGATNPPVAPGQFFAGAAQVTAPSTVLLNGQALPASAVSYVGITPSSPGLYQVNFQIPSNAPDGDLPLVIQIGGVSSPAGAYITVQSPSAPAQ